MNQKITDLENEIKKLEYEIYSKKKALERLKSLEKINAKEIYEGKFFKATDDMTNYIYRIDDVITFDNDIRMMTFRGFRLDSTITMMSNSNNAINGNMVVNIDSLKEITEETFKEKCEQYVKSIEKNINNY